MNRKSIIGLALAAALATASAVYADFPGFVGKGDVQSFFGWNNAGLQANAAYVEFRGFSQTTNEWTCSKPHPVQDRDIVQERNNETTISAVITTVERTRNQVNGFLLTVENQQTITDGPQTGSCPADQSGFEFDDNLQTTQSGGLQIRLKAGAPAGATDWTNFP